MCLIYCIFILILHISRGHLLLKNIYIQFNTFQYFQEQLITKSWVLGCEIHVNYTYETVWVEDTHVFWGCQWIERNHSIRYILDMITNVFSDYNIPYSPVNYNIKNSWSSKTRERRYRQVLPVTITSLKQPIFMVPL